MVAEDQNGAPVPAEENLLLTILKCARTRYRVLLITLANEAPGATAAGARKLLMLADIVAGGFCPRAACDVEGIGPCSLGGHHRPGDDDIARRLGFQTISLEVDGNFGPICDVLEAL